ncbi:MAG: DUF4347 domain-containing protein, partial [Methylococcaceae bacterium]
MSNSILFIDANISDYQSLLTNIDANTEVHILNDLEDGLLQIANIVKGHSNLDAIHIVSHGSSGALSLGSSVLNNADLSSYQTALKQIGSSLTVNGDILLYGCNVAQGNSGQQFIEQLANWTSADIAASTDATGSAALGGDWVLEANTGAIEAAAIFDPLALSNYSGLLPTITSATGGTLGLSNIGYGTGDIIGNSFTATTTGTINSISLLVSTTNAATLKFYAGAGTGGGTLLYTQGISAGATHVAGSYTDYSVITLTIPLSITNTSVYTFTVTDGISAYYYDNTVPGETNYKGGQVYFNGVAYSTYDTVFVINEVTATNTAPTFTTVASTTITINENAGATDISSLLHVSDTDSSQTETWSVVVSPTNGSISGMTANTATSGSANITPGNIIKYTPAINYAGTDSFTIGVGDGNGGTATRVINVNITPVAPSITGLSTATDTGSSSTDGITKNNTPTVSGTAYPNSTVTLYADGSLAGIATANGAGAWSLSPKLALTDGSHTLTTTATVGSLISSASSGYTTTIDTIAPSAPVAPAEKSGNSVLTNGVNATEAMGNIIITTSLSGSGAVAGDSIELLLGGSFFVIPLTAGDITAGSVDFTVAGSVLGADGSKSLTSKVIDIAGNIGSASSALTFTLDTAVPTIDNNKTLSVLENASATSVYGDLTSSDTVTTSTADLIYTVTALPALGTLSLYDVNKTKTDVALKVGDTFSQTSINKDWVKFAPTTGKFGGDTFGFKVADQAGNTTSVQTFNLSITAVNDAPVIAGLDGDSSSFNLGASEYIDNQSGSNLVATVTDIYSTVFNGGYLAITHTGGAGANDGSFNADSTNDNAIKFGSTESGAGGTPHAGDTVWVNTLVSSSGTNWVAVGTIASGKDGQAGNDLRIDFNTTDATPITSGIILGTLKYGSSTGGARTFAVTVNDGDATSNQTSAPVAITMTGTDSNPPTSSNDTTSTLEDTVKVLAITDFGTYSDIETSSPDSIKITTLASHGTLQYNNGSSWVSVTQDQVISKTDIDAGKLRFNPTADFNGSDSIGFKVNDGSNDSASAYTLSVTVNPIADTPSVASPTINEDTDSGAIAISRNTNDSSEITSYKVTGIDGGTLYSDSTYTTAISNGSFIASAGATTNVYFRPTANSDAAGHFTVQASTSNADAGLGGSTATSTITVNPIADTPSVASPTINEDNDTGAIAITRNANDGSEVTFYKVTGISGGTLYSDSNYNNAISNGSFIALAGASTNVYFRPTANSDATGHFTVQASTSNADAGLGGSTATSTI